MVSKYDEKPLRSAYSEGRRHFQNEKKTSLFGSETPRDIKSRNYQRQTDLSNIMSPSDQQIDYDVDRKRFQQEEKWIADSEKKANQYSPSKTSLRQKWEYEQSLKNADQINSTVDKSFPGFTNGFGTGNMRKDGRRASEHNGGNSPNYSAHTRSTPYKEVNNSNSDMNLSNNLNMKPSEQAYDRYVEAKQYADDLENEIEKLKMKQLQDKRFAMNSDSNYDVSANIPDYGSNEYDSSIYREAENRARLRELERLKDVHEYGNNLPDVNLINDEQSYDDDQRLSMQKMDVPPFEKKKTTSNRNDYRQYTMDEYMNSRQQLVNPTHLKRTTLSGSEDINNVGRQNDLDIGDSFARMQNRQMTHENIFPNTGNYSLNKAATPYKFNAPYATD